VAVVVLLVAGGLAAAVGNVAVWARDTALDTDTYLETVLPLAGDEELSRAVAEYLTDLLIEEVGLEQLAEGVLPEDLEALAGLAGPVESAVRPFVEDLIVDILQSDQVAEAWEFVNRTGHELVVDILDGDNQYVMVDGDDIVLDLSPALDAVRDELGEYGIPLPDVVRDEALRFVVFEAPEVAEAVRAVDTLDGLARWLPIAALALLAAAVATGRRRLRVLGEAGAALALAPLLVLLVEAIARDAVLGRITEPIAELAGRSLWDVASGRLVGQTFLLVIVGGVIAAFGFGLDFGLRNARPSSGDSPGDPAAGR
jgi:hypothetical protein